MAVLIGAATLIPAAAQDEPDGVILYRGGRTLAPSTLRARQASDESYVQPESLPPVAIDQEDLREFERQQAIAAGLDPEREEAISTILRIARSGNMSPAQLRALEGHLSLSDSEEFGEIMGRFAEAASSQAFADEYRIVVLETDLRAVDPSQYQEVIVRYLQVPSAQTFLPPPDPTPSP